MIDDDLHDEDSVEPGTIGVGMGGSCPTCRAAVDLGQEFCLECGAPIRFTPRQRTRRGARRPAAAAAGGAAPPRRRGAGFPWIPFLVVLVLLGGGGALMLVDDGSSGSGDSERSGDATEPALPTITSEPPETTTSSDTRTVTLEDCDPARPLDGTQPAIDDGSGSSSGGGSDLDGDGFDDGTGEQIPEFDDGFGSTDPSGGFDVPSSGVPSIEPSSPDSASQETVTVDQEGILCSPDTNSGGSFDDADDGSGLDSGQGGDDTSTTSSSGDWPAGRDGWTVIVAGYPNDEARAQQRAADVQEAGFPESGVLFSSEYRSLCPGFYVVYSGVFDTEDEADAHQAELADDPDFAGTYVREVRSDGAAPDCTRR